MIQDSAVTRDLFDTDATPPMARTSDPETSKLAAEAYSATNHTADKRMMYDVIRRHPGHTSAEYSRILKSEGVDWFKAATMTTKRISDLIANGSVHVSKTRKCEKTGRRAQTYCVAETS